jgi:uncharacterized protein (UPF0548 family)
MFQIRVHAFLVACGLVSCLLADRFALPSVDRKLYACIATPRIPRMCAKSKIKGNVDESAGSMLSWQYPSSAKVEQWFGGRCSYQESESNAHYVYNHDCAGMTLPIATSSSHNHQGFAENDAAETARWPTALFLPDASWRRIRLCSIVGSGFQCYKTCRDVALAWEFRGKSKGIFSVPQRTRDSLHHETRKPNRRILITYSKIRVLMSWCLHVLNPVAVIYNMIDVKTNESVYTATAYGTMRGHWLRGEERACVRYCNASEAVELEIVSYSKPARSIMGYLVWPFIGRMQRSFFDQQIRELTLMTNAMQRI